MFSVSIRDRILIAHSFHGSTFGPAQNLHGATYVVHAEFSSAALNADNVVIEIGAASSALRDVLATLNYRCLDDMPEFKGINTTAEFLARHIHDELRKCLAGDFHGALKIILHESDSAAASFSTATE